MKIILTDEEAHHYMDMIDDITEYKERISELSEVIKTLQLKVDAYQQMHFAPEELPLCEEESIHKYPINTTKEEHTSARWSDYDIARITSRIFLTGTYYGVDREFNTVRALFPNRTRAAVTAMIYHLGGTVKNGIVHPRIQPKQKGE